MRPASHFFSYRTLSNRNVFASLLFASSLAISIVYLFQLARCDIFFCEFRPGTDMYTFFFRAVFLSRNPQLLWPVHAPLYANLFLPAIFMVFGPDAAVARLMNAFLAAGNVLVLFRLAEEVSDRRTAMVTGVIAILYSRFLLYQGVLLSETLGLFLFLFAILLLIRVAGDRPYRAAVCGGICWAFLILVRPKLLLAFAVGLVWVGMKLSPRIRKAIILILLAGTCLVIIRPSALVSMLESARGLFAVYNNKPAVSRMATADDRATGDVRGQAQKLPARFQLAGTIQHITRNAAVFAGPGEEVFDNFPPRYYRMISPLLAGLPLGWGIMVPAGLWGLCLGWRRLRYKALLLAILAAYVSSVLVFQVADRYRLFCEPFLIIFGASGLCSLRDMWRDKRQRAIEAMGILLVAELLYNFNALERRIFPLVLPHGIVRYESGKVIIRDTPELFTHRAYFTILATPGESVIKQIWIPPGHSHYQEARLLIDAVVRAPFELGILVNGKVSEPIYPPAGIRFPSAATLECRIDVSLLKPGLNIFQVRSLIPDTVCIFVDTRFDHNRSAYVSPATGQSYQDLGSNSLIGDGEFRIALSLTPA